MTTILKLLQNLSHSHLKDNVYHSGTRTGSNDLIGCRTEINEPIKGRTQINYSIEITKWRSSEAHTFCRV